MKRKKDDWYENLPMIDKLPLWYELEKTLKELKVNIGIDKLKLCYNVYDDAVIKELEDNKPEFLAFNDFDLMRIEGKYHSDIYRILIPSYNEGKSEMEKIVFGELRFNLKMEKDSTDNADNEITPKEKRVWLYIDNKILHSEGYEMFALEFITGSLGLQLRNVTELEIYIDSTKKNIAKLLKRMIRDKNLKVVLNGKEISDRTQDRNEIGYYHTGDLNKYKYLSLYLFSAKALKNKLDGIYLLL